VDPASDGGEFPSRAEQEPEVATVQSPPTNGLPPDLLAAISADGGGRVVLVTGAGASMEAPTALRSGRQYAEAAYERLLDDGLLVDGDCENPGDLSVLADCVYSKTGSQVALTSRLPGQAWRSATPNAGHWVAAALLIEGALRAVVTLNYDLALQTALAQLGMPNSVTICKGPEDHSHSTGRSLIYLHRSAESPEADWILRQSDLRDAWRSAWEELVASWVAGAPTIVFSGLGSPAAVLTETMSHFGGVSEVQKYYVDPYPENDFRDALEPHLTGVLELGWSEFLDQLSRRVARAQVASLKAAAYNLSVIRNEPEALVSAGVAVLADAGLLDIGRLRADWLVREKEYAHDSEGTERDAIANVLLIIGLLVDVTSGAVTLTGQGLVEIATKDRVLKFRCAHGSALYPWGMIEDRIRRVHGRPSTGGSRTVLTSGVEPAIEELAEDLIRAEDQFDLVRGAESYVRIDFAEVRMLAQGSLDDLYARLAV
jgi:hypothetical protein